MVKVTHVLFLAEVPVVLLLVERAFPQRRVLGDDGKARPRHAWRDGVVLICGTAMLIILNSTRNSPVCTSGQIKGTLRLSHNRHEEQKVWSQRTSQRQDHITSIGTPMWRALYRTQLRIPQSNCFRTVGSNNWKGNKNERFVGRDLLIRFAKTIVQGGKMNTGRFTMRKFHQFHRGDHNIEKQNTVGHTFLWATI